MQRRLTSIPGNTQKLDGGAMFGNAPRTMWSKWAPPDDRNRIDLACRGLLITEPDRKILCETGIGAFFDPEMKDRFGVQEDEHVLLTELQSRGVSPDQIDVVVLSHLHFDHAGGLLTTYQEGEEPKLAFPNARFVVGRDAWDRARDPHPRDRASFIPAMLDLLEQSDRLELVDGATSETLGPDYRFHESNGHTPGMMLIEIPGENGPVVFCGDLVPGVPWVRRAITMGYDRFPELLIDEKTRLFDDLVERGGRLYFTHDPNHVMAALERDEKGRIVAGELWTELDGDVC